MLRHSSSTDSLDWPWNRRKRTQPVIVAQGETSGKFSFESFMLCFVAVFILAGGLQLLIVNIWSLIKRRPYSIFLDVKIDMPYFNIPAAVLSLPTCWVATSLHNSRQAIRFLPLLGILLLITISLLITSSSTGVLMVSNFPAENSVNTSERHLVPISLQEINATLYDAVSNYEVNCTSCTRYVDKVQELLKCCGAIDFNDYLWNDVKVPNSCCTNWLCDSSQNSTFQNGCSQELFREMVWHHNVLYSLNAAMMTIIVFTILISTAVYCSNMHHHNR